MRLLLDESLPHDLIAYLEGFEVATVEQLGWKGIKNGKLLRMARESSFDAIITADRGFEFEQNLARLPSHNSAVEPTGFASGSRPVR